MAVGLGGTETSVYIQQGIVMHACDPNPTKVQTGQSGVQGHPWQLSKSEVRIGYTNLSQTTSFPSKMTGMHIQLSMIDKYDENLSGRQFGHCSKLNLLSFQA